MAVIKKKTRKSLTKKIKKVFKRYGAPVSSAVLATFIANLLSDSVDREIATGDEPAPDKPNRKTDKGRSRARRAKKVKEAGTAGPR